MQMLFIVIFGFIIASSFGGSGSSAMLVSDYPIDINLPSYKESSPFYPKFNGQCTWFAWGRAHQVFGVTYLPTGNAKTWADTALQRGFTVSDIPRTGSVLVLTGSYYGHVAYVEEFTGNYITISEANVNWPNGGPLGGVGTYASDATVLEHMRTVTYNYVDFLQKYANAGLTIAGYIYLEYQFLPT